MIRSSIRGGSIHMITLDTDDYLNLCQQVENLDDME